MIRDLAQKHTTVEVKDLFCNVAYDHLDSKRRRANVDEKPTQRDATDDDAYQTEAKRFLDLFLRFADSNVGGRKCGSHSHDVQ